jgi:hypothetical protein
MVQGVINYIKTLPPYASIIILALVIILILASKITSIINLIKWMMGKKPLKKRTCGDCALIIFRIREIYEYGTKKLKDDLMKNQMRFAEQKLQEVMFFLIGSYNEDIKLYGDDATDSRKATETAFYCECLKNAILLVKDEVRRSFKDGDILELSEREYVQYVKDKTKALLMTARTYLRQYMIQTNESIVKLSKRFDRLDDQHYSKFETWTFEVFTNAKDMIYEAEDKKKVLENNFKKEIDEFIKTGKADSDLAC